MRKFVYFDIFDGPGWPLPSQLQHYFLTPSGRRRAFEIDNDCWGLSADGLDGTERLPANKGRIDLRLTVVGNLRHGVVLHYVKRGGERGDAYFSRGYLEHLWEWVETRHGDLLSIGFFIPFERGWAAVKEFIETDGALPQSIAWIADDDLPPSVFPDPARRSVGQ